MYWLIAVLVLLTSCAQQDDRPIPGRYIIEGIGIVQEYTLSDGRKCAMVKDSSAGRAYHMCSCQ